ncbi:MAG: SurA N-terminal domain-containing protein [Patescibacteria group bacterium]
MNAELSSTSQQEQRTRKALVALASMTLVAVASAWFVHSVYFKRSDSRVVRTLGAGLPVARVGAETVTYGEFVHSRDALKAYLAASAVAQGQKTPSLTPEIEEGAYRRLLREAAVAESARAKGIVVSDDALQQAYDGLIATTSSTSDALASYITATFHLSVDEFRTRMLRPQLLEERVAATLTSSTSTRQRNLAVIAYVDERLAKPDVRMYVKFPPRDP